MLEVGPLVMRHFDIDDDCFSGYGLPKAGELKAFLGEEFHLDPQDIQLCDGGLDGPEILDSTSFNDLILRDRNASGPNVGGVTVNVGLVRRSSPEEAFPVEARRKLELDAEARRQAEVREEWRWGIRFGEVPVQDSGIREHVDFWLRRYGGSDSQHISGGFEEVGGASILRLQPRPRPQPYGR